MREAEGGHVKELFQAINDRKGRRSAKGHRSA
jgi:hypothetical protein